MTARRVLLSGVVLTLVAGLLSALPTSAAPARALADTHAVRAKLTARAAAALGPTGELRSMALNDQTAYRPLDTAIPDFPRLKRDGVTSVTAYVYLYVPNPTGSTVSSGLKTPTDQELMLVSNAAKQNGLDLHLMPVLLDNATNSFRGGYFPSDYAAFMASYTTALVHYADLAESLGVTLFFIGSENDEVARFPGPWRTLIATLRQHYSGALSYMCTGYRAPTVKFWDALDLAAVSPYYSLGEETTVTYDRVMQAWTNNHLPYLANLAKSIKKPIVFGEIGYRSEAGGYGRPANSTGTKLPAPQAQAIAYRAVLDAVAKSPYVYGLTFWRWGLTTGAADTSFSPAGKPAECVMAQHWSTDPQTLQLASLPTCDLSVIDDATNKASSLLASR